MKNNKSDTSIKKNLKEIYQLAKEGISKEDKEFLLYELDGMIKTLEDWKKNNPPVSYTHLRAHETLRSRMPSSA